MRTKESLVSTYFGPSHAPAYDERGAKFLPVRAALDFLIRSVLLGLPDDARILCVGAGTGAELIDLARAFPDWRFTAVEPSAAMLEICRKKATDAGVASRCEFFEGFLESLPTTAPHDAATAILVSQFLTAPDQRRDFFHEIARRLRPGGYLINADLASSLPPDAFAGLFDVWLKCLGAAPGAMKASDMGWNNDVAVLKPQEVEAIIQAGGFEQPTLFYQALFIHGWYAKVKSEG